MKHFHFNIGNLSISVEDGSGYGAPVMFDSVTLCARSRNEKGAIGKRVGVSFFLHRSEVAAIGLGFLDVARKMAPETTWARSEAVYSSAQPRRIIPLTLAEGRDIEAIIKELGVDLVRSPAVSFEKLRKRMPILQKMQYLLERVDDETAAKLDMVLSVVEDDGDLRHHLDVG